MNTTRIARHWVEAGGGPARVDRRGLILAPFLCAALFTCCFAIGRATSPGSDTRAQVPNLQVAFAGAAIPFRLSSAPPIQMQTPVRTNLPAHVASSKAVPVPSARATERAITEETPHEAPAEAVSHPASPPAPAPTPSPTSTQGAGGGAGQSQPHTSTGTSFDSSG